MARLELRNDLEQVAAFKARASVDRIADRVREEAQRRAPAAKVWISARDQFVRPSHVDADSQAVPENLRYRLRKMTYQHGVRSRDRRSVLAGWRLSAGFDLARAPRDPDLPREQRVRCRCQSVLLPDAISRRIFASPAQVQGPRAVARVQVSFNRIAEAEFGNGQDRGVRFMGGAAAEVARRLRR